MRIIGVDPGTRVLGWGVIDLEGRKTTFVGCGAVSPPKSAKRVPERLAAIADALTEIIREHKPDLAAVERAFFGKNAAAALRVGEARGVVLAELARAGVRVEELTPAEVKRAVTGTGGARKQQVQLMVGAILDCKEPIEPLDASDALALAVCLAHRADVIEARRRSARRISAPDVESGAVTRAARRSARRSKKPGRTGS